MNQDFVMPATPAAARKLCRVARVLDMDFDPAISELAKQGRVTVPPEYAEYGEAIQNIIDADFRQIIPYRDFWDFGDIVLLAHGVTERFKRIEIITNDRFSWEEYLRVNVDRDGNLAGARVTVHERYEGAIETVSSDDYDTTLMMVDFGASEMFSPACVTSEFPHSIVGIEIEENKNPDGSFSQIHLSTLYPEIIEPSYFRKNTAAEWLEPKGFRHFHFDKLGFLVGVETALLMRPDDHYEAYDADVRAMATKTRETDAMVANMLRKRRRS